MDLILLCLTIAAALAFDFTNGAHDVSNIVSTSISTRAVSARAAVALAAILIFVGAFLSIEVATTVGGDIIKADIISQSTILAALIGAIVWNITTWWLALPSSSTHALIGGLVGATFASAGLNGIVFNGLVFKVLIPAIAVIAIAFLIGGLIISLLYILFAKSKPQLVNRLFRLGQLPTSALLALSHGMNDAQKTMGVIVLALITYGAIDADNFHVPLWVIASSAGAIALGAYTGGWRVIKTVGSKIIKMDPVQGFATQSSSSLIILASSLLGFPLSTTHVVSSSIMGVGATKRLSAVRWGVAKNIIVAWLITLPGAALISATIYFIFQFVSSL